MPPVKKRIRTYDPAKTRAAVLAQFGHIREAVRVLTPERLALPTRLGDWTVRELVAHVGTTLEGVTRLLDQPEPVKRDATVLDWPFATSANSGAIADTAHRLAEEHPDLVAFLADVERDFTAHLDAYPGTRLLATSAGAMPLADCVVTRTVELVVHTDDLNAAVPGFDIPLDRQALAACTRLLADALAVKAPGASTEVRIPPYAVVQCVEGPRHTRGTPPNVVETDPLTWIRLATGRTEWKTALDEAKVSASGERADLGGLLPLMG
ncbi:sterol carrier family protein [Streptomyces sp. RLB1-33]|uniref:maleylpyruvate isomerase family mycothiol-dependent enzyme n=1 Tax=Streptomyces mirabilis TaxID=68239 RepID=UPI00143E6A5C|nr:MULTISPECIES: maleylpyruvate isomerase family mycothiol-dependent enzyme [Streptomyces]QIY71976.1 maleylpyruvate isomerase family mycothiol-dependent enzyme [Streptomyces sp. RLB1-33]QUW81044.1 maleylpyruvate isomerase family mycothiol-dependent enzyme [Streptomyces mirabilis]